MVTSGGQTQDPGNRLLIGPRLAGVELRLPPAQPCCCFGCCLPAVYFCNRSWRLRSGSVAKDENARRKRAQRAVLLLLITAPQTTLHHSHQVACGSLAPRAQLLLQLSILVSERRLPARITAQQCHFLFSQIPEMDWLPSERFSRSQEQSGAFSYPIPGFGATPCRIWLHSLRLVLILCNDIIYPHSHQEMPRFLVASVHQRIPNDLGWVLLIKDSYSFLSVRLKTVGDINTCLLQMN